MIEKATAAIELDSGIAFADFEVKELRVVPSGSDLGKIQKLSGDSMAEVEAPGDFVALAEGKIVLEVEIEGAPAPKCLQGSKIQGTKAGGRVRAVPQRNSQRKRRRRSNTRGCSGGTMRPLPSRECSRSHGTGVGQALAGIVGPGTARVELNVGLPVLARLSRCG